MKRLRLFFADIPKHEILMLSASLSYTTALALAPFLVIALAILAVLPGDIQRQFTEQLTALFGAQAGEATRVIIQHAERESHFTGLSGWLGALVIAVSASAIFSQIRIALDKINEHRAGPTDPSGWKAFLREKVFSVGLVFGFIFLLIVSLVVTTVIAAAFRGQEGLLWQTISFVTNLVLFSLLFTAVFRFIPSDKLPWSHSILAGFVATVFFLVGKTAVGLYLGKSALGSAYGAAGSLVTLLVWVYYTSLTFFLSYEFSLVVLGFRNLLREENPAPFGPGSQAGYGF